ncbi:MAG TPA: histidine kinase [Candidatus Magasanikbacteria bacterium]|nr:histidine kinase [Candidatus Magasanikbacteria bacterium]
MNIKTLILEELSKKNSIKTSDIIKKTGFSRAYINRFLQELRDEGKIFLIGKTNSAKYVLAKSENFLEAKKQILIFEETFINQNLSEDIILKKIKQTTGIFYSVPNNIENILDYSFLEMVNNAIEHSASEKIRIEMKKENDNIIFIIEDQGIGIFANIKNKFNLPDTLSAIQELLKGKKTTEPTQHSGQGIFFTSKLADSFTIKSSDKVLMFNNIINDLFIEDRKTHAGTTIIFSINLGTKKTTKEIFDAFTNQEYEFSKTQVKIKLFRVGKNILSRSEARRVMIGLESFQDIILDFEGVESIGQAFADEIFRIWKNNHPNINITYINANENVEFMIKRVL